jgi:hypothetical protein
MKINFLEIMDHSYNENPNRLHAGLGSQKLNTPTDF